jgi:hypothetical protein
MWRCVAAAARQRATSPTDDDERKTQSLRSLIVVAVHCLAGGGSFADCRGLHTDYGTEVALAITDERSPLQQ